jgi:hypothetical protein
LVLIDARRAALLDGGYACKESLSTFPLHNQLKAAMNVCVSTPDNNASYHRLVLQEQEAKSKLNANSEARTRYKEHLLPLLSIQGLEGHSALDDIMAKVKGANAALEDEKLDLEETVARLSDKRRRVHIKITASRTAWAASPSVVTWCATSLHPRTVASSAEVVTRSGEHESAREALTRAINHMHSLNKVAEHLEVHAALAFKSTHKVIHLPVPARVACRGNVTSPLPPAPSVLLMHHPLLSSV